jgi:hypothetical protein
MNADPRIRLGRLTWPGAIFRQLTSGALSGYVVGLALCALMLVTFARTLIHRPLRRSIAGSEPIV